MPTKDKIDDFLRCERVAMIGVSRNSKEFANAVYRTLRDRGYVMFPVNPHAERIEGDECVHSIAELPDVDGAIVMVPADRAADVVRDCADRGITKIWLHRGSGAGAVSPEALEVGRTHSLDVVDGACPLMFIEPTGWIHRMHRRISGRRILAG